MRTGLVIGIKGLDLIPQLDNLANDRMNEMEKEVSEEEDGEAGEECYEEETSELYVDSDED